VGDGPIDSSASAISESPKAPFAVDASGDEHATKQRIGQQWQQGQAQQQKHDVWLIVNSCEPRAYGTVMSFARDSLDDAAQSMTPLL